MRLRIAQLLADSDMTAYGLAQASDGRISISTAYRLAGDDWDCLTREMLDALCDTLHVGPGELLERGPSRASSTSRKPGRPRKNTERV